MAGLYSRQKNWETGDILTEADLEAAFDHIYDNLVASTTSAVGLVQLEDSVTSTSITKAATPKSVKEAYDHAGGDTLPVVDTTGIAKGSVDATKIVRLEVDGLTTATTRVLTVPDKDMTLADASVVATNTAKTTNATHTGEITGSGALTITDKAVTLAKMNDMATASLLGRNTALAGVPEVLSKATSLSLLNVADGADVTADNETSHATVVVDADIGVTVAACGANADITSTTALTQITRATGGTFDIAIGGAAGDDFTVDTSKLVVEGDTGNVGVGTATPDRSLHVYTTSGSGVLKGETTDTASYAGCDAKSDGGQAFFLTRGSTCAATLFGINNADTTALYNIGQKLLIGTHGVEDVIIGTSNTERIRITSTGNVGIGTTAPGGKLCVNGGVTVGSDTDAGDNNLRVEGNVNIIGTLEAVSVDHGTAATDQIVNVCYGTGDPPAANTTTIGSLFVKYTA